MKSFYFDIEGEIAHFRDPTSHQLLNTFPAPPPHTIIGLIASCHGLEESQVGDLAKRIRVGCKPISLSGTLRDMSLIENQKETPPKKIPRMRKFLVNPKYRIFIASEDTDFLIKLKDSVKSPQHIPYLGISDCIASIRFVSDIMEAHPIMSKEYDCIIPFDDNNNFTTIVKDQNSLTMFSQIISTPTSYVIMVKGRKPVSQRRYLMSVNCKIKFRKNIEGIEVGGENVCLL